MWKTPEPDFPVRLTYVQRQAIASLLPEYAGRLQLDQRSQRTLRLALSELRRIHSTCRAAVHHAATGAARNSLRLIINASNKAIEQCEKKSIHCIPASERLYQLRISLVGSRQESGGEFRPRTARCIACTSTSKLRWGGGTTIFTDLRLATLCTAISNCSAGSSRKSRRSWSRIIAGSAKSFPKMEADMRSATSTTSVTAGDTTFSSRAVFVPLRASVTRSAWKVNGPARPKTWAAFTATGSILTHWPIQSTRNMRNRRNGEGHSSQRHLTPGRPPSTCGVGV